MNPKTFLGDAAFDAVNIYKSLFEEIGFQKAFIANFPGIVILNLISYIIKLVFSL